MRCEQARQLMNAYVDREINDQEQNKLNVHLDSCESCTVEFEELKYMVQLMGEIDLKELPLGFEEELHEKLLMAAQEVKAENKVNEKQNSLTNILNTVKRFKWKRIYTAYVALPLVLMIVVLASKGLNLGGAKYESAVAASDLDDGYMQMETTAAMFGRGEMESEESATFSKSMDSANYLTAAPAEPPSTTDGDYREGRMIIQTASLNMDVEKYDQVMETLKNKVAASGGYVENESTSFKTYYSDTDNLKQGYITIRIPANGYNTILSEIKALGLVTMESSNANDITKMYRDTASEIENLKVTENRLREIMEKAVEIEDILAIENELNRVRSSINMYQKQIKDWEALVDMTTITVQLNEMKSLKPVVEPIDDSLFGKAKEGFIRSINNIRRSIESLIIWVVANSPFLVMLTIIALVISVIYKKRRAKK